MVVRGENTTKDGSYFYFFVFSSPYSLKMAGQVAPITKCHGIGGHA